MSQIGVIDFSIAEGKTVRGKIAAVLNHGVFYSLLLLLIVSAIPYGTAEQWWKAAFVSAVCVIASIAIGESLLSGEARIGGSKGVLLSMLSLSVFAFLQTITIQRGNEDAAISALNPWNALSADPYQTQFFVMQMLALTACLALCYRYCNSERRINILFHTIIVIAVVSALFGILRQTVQQQPGFLLPRTRPGQGFGQFVNKNHFAYLMEMAFGLGLGLSLGRGLKRERVVIYVALLLPIWIGLVLSNSRGGILAMLVQVVVAALLLTGGGITARISAPSYSRFVRVGLIACLLAVVIGGTIWTGGDRLVSSFGAASTELNPEAEGSRQGATRNEIWRASWKMFTAHPITGVGMGGYWIAITAYHDASGKTTPQEAHNDYLELLSSGGLIGLAIGIWFAVSLFSRVRENLASPSRFQRALCFSAVLAITGVAAHSLVDFGLHLLVNAFVFVILIMFATTKLRRHESLEA